MKKLLVLGVIAIAIFLRFYNLEVTSRFTRDESSNLYDIHRIWETKKITLVGPVDVTKTIIYPSLTFYMLLPFAVLGHFEPVSPAYGTAFFGVLTVGVFYFLARKINKKFATLVGLLSIIWYPLVESSRWAWNPHLVPFTSSVALLLFFINRRWSKFASGVFFGLSFHLHYLTVISFVTFAGLWTISSFTKKKFIDPILVGIGFVITIIPFIIFDLKNPPGLFFGKFLRNNLVTAGAGSGSANFMPRFIENIKSVFMFISQSQILALIIAVCVLILVFYDLFKKRINLLFFLPVVTQIAIISFLPSFQTRYFLLGITFFVVWLISPRDKAREFVTKIIIIIAIIGSVVSIKSLLTHEVYSSPYTIRIATNFIKEIATKNDLKNINIGVLASPDQDPLGIVYRHTLAVKGVDLLDEDQHGYAITDNLFIVTNSSDETVRNDAANIINGFRQGKIVNKLEIDNGWKVYLFNRDKR